MEYVNLSASSLYIPGENSTKYLIYGAGTSEVKHALVLFVYLCKLPFFLISSLNLLGTFNFRLRLIFLLEQLLF